MATRPSARANSRTWRGLATYAGSSASTRAVTTGSSYPPDASRTTTWTAHCRNCAVSAVSPACVVATRHGAHTAGSTATGSFDDLEAVSSICDQHGVWLHVDAAHGGTALLSSRHRQRLRGIDRARSVAWDPHKMLLIPSQAGMLLVRDERDLDAAFSQRAPYLFQTSNTERTWDQGTRSFMCSRRADVLKVWVALQRYGSEALGEMHDYFCDLTRQFYEEIAERPDFVAMHEPESNILCFRYVGDGSHSDEELDRLNRDLRERYNLSGEGWITGTNLDGRRVLRVTIMNPRTTPTDLRDVLDGLAAVGQTLSS